MSSGRRTLVASCLGAVGASAGLLVGALTEAHAFLVRRYRVPVLPSGTPPIRVLHISDLHLTLGQHDKRNFLGKLASLQPDLVVGTGDYLSDAGALEDLLTALGPLLEVPGAFVFGSNDFAAPRRVNPAAYLVGSSKPAKHTSPGLPWRQMRAALVSRGWSAVDNRCTRIRLNGATIDLRGTGDAHHHLDHYAAVGGPVASDADLTIGVTHAPYRRVLDAMTNDSVPLILAGHTHGGQVCLPVNRAITTNCDLPRSHASGLHQWHTDGHTSWLHVSAGLGTSPYAPYRLFCRPEVSLLTLVGH